MPKDAKSLSRMHLYQNKSPKYKALKKFASIINGKSLEKIIKKEDNFKKPPSNGNFLVSKVTTEDFIDCICKGVSFIEDKNFFPKVTANDETVNDLTKEEIKEKKDEKNIEEKKGKEGRVLRTSSNKNYSELPDPPLNGLHNSSPFDKTKQNSSPKSSSSTPRKTFPSKEEEERKRMMMKRKLRKSTRALTSASDREQLMKLKRRLSDHLSPEKNLKEQTSPTSTSMQTTSKSKLSLEIVTMVTAKDEDFRNISLFINSLCQTPLPLFHILPPEAFKVECNIPQQARFPTHNQYIHRFFDRWGHNSIELACLTAHLDSQNLNFSCHPLAGGVEVDMVGLLEAITKHGGVQKVMETNTWSEVVKEISVPKNARDKIPRFYEIYCRYLLPYDTLPIKEKTKLLNKIKASMHTEEADELCVAKGRCRSLSELYVTARNVASMFDLEEASNQQILKKYWKIIEETSPHVTVHTAFIKPSDISSSRQRNFFRNKLDITSMMKCCDDPFCFLFSDEDVIDSRLEVEMVFSTRCWSRDPHSRGLISYNHTGADVVWYCVRGQDEEKMKRALLKLNPHLIDPSKTFWLTSNNIMISPEKLIQQGIPVFSCTQQAGHFIIIPPSSIFSSSSCGYSISEHAHFLPHNWLLLATKASRILHESHVTPVFSIERFLFSLLSRECFLENIQRDLTGQKQEGVELKGKHPQHLKRHLSNPQIHQAFSLLNQIVCRELKLRRTLINMGVRKRVERVMGGGGRVGSDLWMTSIGRHKVALCSISKAFCFFSKVQDLHGNESLCLDCASSKLLSGSKPSHFEIILFFNQSELQDYMSKIKKDFQLTKELRAS